MHEHVRNNLIKAKIVCCRVVKSQNGNQVYFRHYSGSKPKKYVDDNQIFGDYGYVYIRIEALLIHMLLLLFRGQKYKKNAIIVAFYVEKHLFRVKKKRENCIIIKISLSLRPKKRDVGSLFLHIICLLIKFYFHYEQDRFHWRSCPKCRTY